MKEIYFDFVTKNDVVTLFVNSEDVKLTSFRIKLSENMYFNDVSIQFLLNDVWTFETNSDNNEMILYTFTKPENALGFTLVNVLEIVQFSVKNSSNEIVTNLQLSDLSISKLVDKLEDISDDDNDYVKNIRLQTYEEYNEFTTVSSVSFKMSCFITLHFVGF